MIKVSLSEVVTELSGDMSVMHEGIKGSGVLVIGPKKLQAQKRLRQDPRTDPL